MGGVLRLPQRWTEAVRMPECWPWDVTGSDLKQVLWGNACGACGAVELWSFGAGGVLEGSSCLGVV